MCNASAECIRALRDRTPITAFEQIAAAIEVDVDPWNGGAPRRVSLFEVLKYPTAFDVPSLRVVSDPKVDVRWLADAFYIRHL